MSTNAESPSATILVVDDNEANRALAQGTLEDEGYRVILARGGAEGIAAFESERPDCVLLDIRMPDVDGFTVCTRLRALPGGSETAILFLTALRDVDTFDHALRAGGDDFLSKPIRPTELVVRVQTALKLRRANVEIREHYDLLRHQRDALLRLQLQKERLMAFVVHDLKNPVNSLDLHAQLVLREGDLSTKVRHSVTRMRVVVQHLNRMIHELLDLSKADEGQLAARRCDVDLRGLVEEVISELSLDARNRKVELQILLETDGIYADEDLFRRTLTNLIGNAIRYAPPETPVKVAAVRLGAETEVRVSDTGIGVPPPMREKVFDPFVQVESGKRVVARGSHGLGLAFCKLVIEAHGGRIWIEDAAPGAVFCIRVPNC